jgi:hypothetical protein
LKNRLRGIAKALRPDGTLVMVDIATSSHVSENIHHLFEKWMYTLSLMHCMTVSLGGVGLGAMWGEQKALQMQGEAGFSRIKVVRIEGDIFNNYYVAAKQTPQTILMPI